MIEDIARIKKEYASDPSKYSALRAALSMPLTERNLGIRDAEFTGANSPSVENPAALITHIDSFFSDFHLGTMAKLYAQLGLKSTNYSAEIINHYLTQILKDKSDFQLVPCLSIADLVFSRHQAQPNLFGLAKNIKTFLATDDVEILIIPIRLRAQWQLITVNKLSQQVDIFAPSTQPELMQKMLAIVKGNVPEDFTCRHKPFNNHVPPIYYGAIIVEVVKHLSVGESYVAVLSERFDEKLLLLSQTQEKLFKPSQSLLDTQQTIFSDAINPVISKLLMTNLLNIYYHKYPEVLDAKLLDLAIDAVEINDIRDSLLTIENPYLLHQAFCDEKLIRALFKSYQEAARELQAKLVAARATHEALLSDNLNIAAKKALTQQFTDEETVKKFKQDIPVQVYGNWFADTSSRPGPVDFFFNHRVIPQEVWDSQHAQAVQARGNFVEKQIRQIKQFKESFVVTAKEKFKFDMQIDLYNHQNYTDNLLIPCFIFPEQDGNPVLPNLVSGYDNIPIEMLQAQALGISHIELRYHIDAAANRFILKVCLMMHGSHVDSCMASYSINYKNADDSFGFYEGPEAIWWFWVGGECVQQKIVPRKEVVSTSSFLWHMDQPFWMTDRHQRYFDPVLTKRTGAGYTPLSSFTKLTNVTDPSSQLLLKEVNERVAKKYQEMRKALNQELSNDLNNQASSLGQALVKFEQSYKVLRLFLEFIFADAMGNPSNALHAVLYNDKVIYNKEKLLAFLSNSTEEYVATKIISDATLTMAQTLCISRLSVQVQMGPQHLNDLEKDLMQAYDDFTPYQVAGKPSTYELNAWQKGKIDLFKLKADFFQHSFLSYMSLSAEEQQRAQPQLLKTNADVKNIEEEFTIIDQNFQSGRLTLADASTMLQSNLGVLRLTSTSSSSSASESHLTLSRFPFWQHGEKQTQENQQETTLPQIARK